MCVCVCSRQTQHIFTGVKIHVDLSIRNWISADCPCTSVSFERATVLIELHCRMVQFCRELLTELRVSLARTSLLLLRLSRVLFLQFYVVVKHTNENLLTAHIQSCKRKEAKRT